MMSADRTRTSLRRRAVLAMAITMIGVARAANAHAGPYSDPVDLKVVDRETGQPLPIWRHDGRLFVAGQPGARYNLRVTNHTNGRVLVVMSVDGVNIVTGETAGYGQHGYVLAPYGSYDASGWRKSLTEVADFTFAPLPQSYAARTGRPGDVGVIGIAVFKERAAYQSPPAVVPRAEAPAFPPLRVAPVPRPVPLAAVPPKAPSAPASNMAPPQRLASSRGVPMNVPAPPPLMIAPAAHPAPPPPALPSPAAIPSVVVTAQRQAERLGTAHGEREWSVTSIVSFDRATSYPQFISQIEYDSYDNLIARGVIPGYPPPEAGPRPFPSTPDGWSFVPDPPDDP